MAWHSVFYLLSLSCSTVLGALSNYTVDDTYPDTLSGEAFLYDPQGIWNVGGQCTSCLAQPDTARVYAGTWHDATSTPSQGEVQTASFQFKGSAFYLYGILSHSTANPTSAEDLYFFVDDQAVGHFTYTPPDPGNNTYSYNVLLYANNTIPPGVHNFKMQNGLPNGTVSLVLLDYAIYSQDPEDFVTSTTSSTSTSSSSTSSTPSPPSPTQPPATSGAAGEHKKSNSHTIIAAVVPSVVASAIIAIVLLLVARRRMRRKRALQDHVPLELDLDDPQEMMAQVTPYPHLDDSVTPVTSSSKGRSSETQLASSSRSPNYLEDWSPDGLYEGSPARSAYSSRASRSGGDPPPAYESVADEE